MVQHVYRNLYRQRQEILRFLLVGGGCFVLTTELWLPRQNSAGFRTLRRVKPYRQYRGTSGRVGFPSFEPRCF